MNSKISFIFFAVLLHSATMWAQSPEKMSYQAIIRDADYQLVKEQVVGMQISILQETPEGTEVYTETQVPLTNANGLVSIEIGDGTTSDDLSTLDWTKGPYFLKTEIDPAGGTDYSISGTSQLLSVPYALHAKTADSISNNKYIITSRGDERYNPQIAFFAINSSDDKYESSSFEKVEFDKIIFEQGNCFDEKNDLFTAPMNGVYSFATSVIFRDVTVGDRINLLIYLNNKKYAYLDIFDSPGSFFTARGTITLLLNKSDEVKIVAYSADETWQVGGSDLVYTHFSGHLVYPAYE